MISWIKGKIIYKNEDFVIVSAGRVGYKVFISKKTYFSIKDKEEVEFYTYLYTREDIMDLYGFESLEEMKFFEAVISVSGIGPKVGLAILAQGTTLEIKRAVASNDILFFNAVPGIGRKKAEKFIIEIRDKIDNVLPEKDSLSMEDSEEVIEALKQLGYSSKEVVGIVRKIPNNIEKTEKRVAWALKNIGQNIVNNNC